MLYVITFLYSFEYLLARSAESECEDSDTN